MTPEYKIGDVVVTLRYSYYIYDIDDKFYYLFLMNSLSSIHYKLIIGNTFNIVSSRTTLREEE